MNVRCTAMLALMPVALIACAGASTTASRPKRADPELITREQIQAGNFHNAYDAVEALHANWLIVRNVTPSTGQGLPQPSRSDTGRVVGSSGRPIDADRSAPGMNAGIQVYVDGNRIGGVQELRRLATSGVYSIRRYSATESQTRYGVGHSNGVIAVATGPDKP